MNNGFRTFVDGFNANFANVMVEENLREKMTSERMKDVLAELMNLSFPSGDVFKAANIFTVDKDKIDVLFNLPLELRRNYVVMTIANLLIFKLKSSLQKKFQMNIEKLPRFSKSIYGATFDGGSPVSDGGASLPQCDLVPLPEGHLSWRLNASKANWRDRKDLQRCATGELRLLSQCSQNRNVIADCGVVNLLVGLLHSSDPATQVNAVTVLLNLSIDDRNKISIANYANAIVSLIDVLIRSGIPEAKENSAATLSSLAKIEENRVQIGESGAIGPLVELLANGTPRGKEDAVTALYNLSKCRANMVRIAQSGAVAHLVGLIDHAAAGLVDKAVTILANLATTSEARIAIGQDGVSALVDVVELGSSRGKENAAAALLQLCRSSSKYCRVVLQQGGVPSLVALSRCGTPRAKEKATSLLNYFQKQREAYAGDK
ncbi:U-box domain-containing protein 4-like [Zingiber officinale]|uniref:U-box domain-containing protein 4-like n=1 Tax=Zingiber officinale TaxID=94328 RepID=UPI001C4B69CB|nr:U-box domain-containing protein 4-like [Zingiber officinale]